MLTTLNSNKQYKGKNNETSILGTQRSLNLALQKVQPCLI